MTSMTSAPTATGGAITKAILAGGLIGGALDILYAFTVWGMRGVPPVRISQSVASGWLGKASFQGGNATAALGLASHFVIALGMAAVYVAASTRLPVLRRRPWLCGVAYGVVLYVAMTYVVVPLSAAQTGPFSWTGLAIGIAPHIVFVGPAIALAARWALGPGEARA
jgi:hypothetical protein